MKFTCIHTIWRGLRAILRQTKHTLFPCSLPEIILFLLFFLIYGTIGYQLLYHTDLLDVQTGDAGSYLGYDNLFHLKTNGGSFDISHPFFNLFHLTKYMLVKPFVIYFGEKARAIVCLVLMNLLVSGGLTLLYRYLKQITGLTVTRAALLTLFTGSFFTMIVLSFTTETYPFSFFLLVFSLLMISRELKLTGYVKGRTILFLVFLCGGVTITNAAKPATAVFLNKTSLFRMIRTGVKVMLPFVVCVALFLGLYSLKYHFSTQEEGSPIENTGKLNRYFIHDQTFGKQAFTDFWGNTILTTPLALHEVDGEVVLRPSEYLNGLQNAIVVILLILTALSACLNLGNRYVLLLLMYLGVDAVIHFIIRYGMNEGIIFGGHWMFAIPILLGWLYNKLPVRGYRILDWIITAFFLVTAINNGMEFMRLWEELT